MPLLLTKAVIARGASVANQVAAIEVPKSHQGKLRPATKKSSIFSEPCLMKNTLMMILIER
jgi:hypothetical protein